MVKEVVILGKGPQWSEEFKSYCQTHSENDYEVWTVGTHPFPRASRYYEFHGLSYEASPMRKYIRESPSEVYTIGVPVNNSITAIMLIAYLEGIKSFTILGCPMDTRTEYIAQKPALAECVGFLRGKGLNIVWSDEPKNEKYGFPL